MLYSALGSSTIITGALRAKIGAQPDTTGRRATRPSPKRLEVRFQKAAILRPENCARLRLCSQRARLRCPAGMVQREPLADQGVRLCRG